MSFRIFSTTRSVADLSQLLGLAPTHAHDRGAPRLPQHPEAGAFQSTGWFLDAGRGEFSTQLDVILTLLEPKAQVLESLAEEAQIDLSCGLFARGGLETVEVDCDQLARLAALHVPLTLALHPPAAPKQAVHGDALFDAGRWNRKWHTALMRAESGTQESPLDPSLPFEAHVARLLRPELPENAALELTFAAANGQGRAMLSAHVLARIAERRGRLVLVLAPPPMGGASA